MPEIDRARLELEDNTMPLIKPTSLLISVLLSLSTVSAAADDASDARPKIADDAPRSSKPERWDGVDRQMLKRASERAKKPKAPVFPAEKR